MAAPWGGSPYPTAYPHSPPSAGRSCDDRPRPQFPQPSIPGFYNPALPVPGSSNIPFEGPSSPPARPGPMNMPIPSILMPGAAPYGQRSPHLRSYSKDWFFENNAPRPPRPPRLQHTQSEPPPPLPRKPDASPPQPPLPAKPSLSSPPGSVPQLYPKHVAAAAGMQMPTPDMIRRTASSSAAIREEPDEDEELRRVLELSAQEAQRQASVDDEDEELARALRESLQAAQAFHMPEVFVDRRGEISPVVSSPVDFPSALSPAPLPPVSAPPTQTTFQLSPPDAARERRESAHSHGSSVSAQITEDEALARRWAEEDRFDAERGPHPQPVNGPPLPRYEAVAAPVPTAPMVPPKPSPSASPSVPPYSMPQAQHASPPPSVSPSLRNRSQSAHAVESAPSQPVPVDPRLGRSQSVGASEDPNLAGPSSAPSGRSSMASSMVAPNLKPVPEAGPSHNNQGHLSQGPGASNQYVDVELLRGVSLGFGVPVITPSFAPMQGPIPNVVALPYGKAPPFHIRAPTWRGLLKLMARCASTRVEPTIEATALVKIPMKLRIVIAFVKVHHASSDWHSILFMTIDYPVPKGSPGWKHRIADPNTLPWSYTLSQPLALLRDGADAPMSKYYCIPGTQETPYPTLPITFPDLATYLTAVLEDSRRAIHDSSSGMRRLAKAIDTFYPNETPVDASEERGGVRKKFLNFVGMGSKPQRDRNADTYELVTPFVPDDFGR